MKKDGVAPPPALQELAQELTKRDGASAPNDTTEAVPETGTLELALISAAQSIDEKIWFHICAQEALSPFQKKLAFTMAQLAQRKQAPSLKQSFWGLDALLTASEKGLLEQNGATKPDIRSITTLIERSSPQFRKSK